MDIMGSALANPTVPWAYSNNRLMSNGKCQSNVDETTSETDRPSASKKRRSYQSSALPYLFTILDTLCYYIIAPKDDR